MEGWLEGWMGLTRRIATMTMTGEKKKATKKLISSAASSLSSIIVWFSNLPSRSSIIVWFTNWLASRSDPPSIPSFIWRIYPNQKQISYFADRYPAKDMCDLHISFCWSGPPARTALILYKNLLFFLSNRGPGIWPTAPDLTPCSQNISYTFTDPK